MKAAEIFELDEAIEVVDIGSNPIEGKQQYEALLTEGVGRLVGFEPQAETAAEVRKAADKTILPWAIGGGDRITFYRCAHSGWSSTLKPAAETIQVFDQYRPNARVVETFEIDTRRLDEIEEIQRIDYLKIDIQGGELAVFRNGRKKLSETVFVHTEVAFIPLYDDQPMFSDIDRELRGQGFIPHCFASLKRAVISPFRLDNDPWKTINQILDGDMVYVRDFRRVAALSDSQLKRMAVIAHECYRSWDLAYRLALVLEERGAVKRGAPDAYLGAVNEILWSAPT